MKKPANCSPETLAAHGLHEPDPITGAVNPAIQASSTYARDEQYRLLHGETGYSRADNPGFRGAERLLCALEGGEDAMLFSSGMAAATAVFRCLQPGDRIVAPRIMYWGLRSWLVDFCAHWGLDLEPFDASDPNALELALSDKPARLVWIETPCNPSWDIIDIEAAAKLARASGAVLAVDSTAATPVLTRPLALGADLVMHSATKYLNGHSDAVAGALVSARMDDLWRQIGRQRVEGGAVPGALEAYLVQRGMRTLFLRVRQSCASALEIARQLSDHPRIQRVLYPGLSNHPGHAVAQRQMEGGFGGMMTLEIRGGEQDALEVIKRCRLFTPATSFGGVESLVEHRYSVEGPESPVPANWIRVSVGIEAVEDLLADLMQALD